ncbi:MAG: amidohydrolase family protein [Bacteroidota bacterium]
MKKQDEAKSISIEEVTIIDGTGNAPFVSNVFIEKARIAKITNDEMPKQTHVDKRINGKGMYLLPGMIDCHVHVMINEHNLFKHLQTPFSYNFYAALKHLKSLLFAGITSARDAGGADFGVKKALQDGLIEGPNLKISISPLTTTGGHFDAFLPSSMQSYILAPPYPGYPDGVCDGEMEVRKKVREVLRAGADVIKICSTGGVSGWNDDPNFEEFSMNELKIVVEEAAMRKKRRVMVHAQGTAGIKNAIRAGVHSIEHGVDLDDEAVELMLKNDVFLVPTLLAVNSVIHGDYPKNTIEIAKRMEETHFKSIEKAHKAGVKIAMGTDSGVMAHGRNLEELKLMCDAGMSAMEAITASTKTAAQCLEIDDLTGTIEEGKMADFILVQENPVQKIGSLYNDKNLKVLCKEGMLIKHI